MTPRIDWPTGHALWEAKVPTDLIALRLGTVPPTIYKYAFKHGWSKRPRGRKPAGTQAAHLAAERLWRTTDLTSDEIARRVGYRHGSTIRHFASRFGWGRCVGSPCTTGVNAGNRETEAEAADRQLQRLERALAAEPKEMIALRRCDVCHGLENPAYPHVHARAAA